MNSFDAAVYILAIVALVTGFKAGFLRSTATILGYLAAMPIALTATRVILAVPADKVDSPWTSNPLLFFAVFLATAIVLGALLRIAVGGIVGPSISLVDRLAGSALGAARIALVAVTVVVVWDRLIPVDRQPAFLNGSHLRPILSLAGQRGLKSLPPDIARFIDQAKANRQI